MILQRPTRVHQCDVVLSENLNERLVHLEQGKVAPDAEVRAASKLEKDQYVAHPKRRSSARQTWYR
jgi:hypothetical protein